MFVFHKCDYHFKFIEDAINVKNLNGFFNKQKKKKKGIEDDKSLSMYPSKLLFYMLSSVYIHL